MSTSAGVLDQVAGGQPTASSAPPQTSSAVLDQVAAGNSDAVSQTPPAMIAATHEPQSWIGKFARWTENVSNDLKYGTDETGIGTILKKMGAHGVYAGNSEHVGDFMASLPLGLLKAGKGASEMTPAAMGGPKGQTLKGLEDVMSGGLQAATIPSAFVAPEAAEGAASVAGKATDATEAGARGASGAVRRVASEIGQGKNIAQPGAQDAIRAATGAADGEKIVEGSKSVMDGIVEKLDTMRSDLYKQASDKAGFDVQQAREQLESAEQRLKLTEGTDAADIAQQAKQQIVELKNKLSGAQDADPDLLKAANQAHGKYMGAVQFRKALVRATDVDGTVDVPKLLTASKNLRFTKYGDQLGSFMGKAQADEYMQHLEAMRDMGAHAVKVQNLAKWVGKIAGAGVLLEGANAAKGALTP